MKNQKLSRGGALLAACLLAVSAVTVPVFAEEESGTTAAVTESIETTDSAESADSAESSDETDEPDAAEEAADGSRKPLRAANIPTRSIKMRKTRRTGRSFWKPIGERNPFWSFRQSWTAKRSRRWANPS